MLLNMPIVLMPEELEERLAIGDQFIEEIVTKGEILYTGGSNDG